MKENNTNLKKVLDEIKLNKFLDEFENYTCDVRGQEYVMNYIISADWIGLQTELNLEWPNTPKYACVLAVWSN